MSPEPVPTGPEFCQLPEDTASGPGLLPWTLVGAPGIGNSRERALWQEGGWDRGRLANALERIGIPLARQESVFEHTHLLDFAVQRQDFRTAWNLLPVKERWRVLPLLTRRAAYVDLEMDGGQTAAAITLVSVRTLDAVSCWTRGTDPGPTLSLLERSDALITYGGANYDVPLLKAAWPELRLPAIHVDLNTMVRRLAVTGGLKGLEAAADWHRAEHLRHLRGPDAVTLWQQWLHLADPKALEILCEYNLEDVWSLPALASWCHDKLARKLAGAAQGAPPLKSTLETWQERPEAGPMVLRAALEAVQKAVATRGQ